MIDLHTLELYCKELVIGFISMNFDLLLLFKSMVKCSRVPQVLDIVSMLSPAFQVSIRVPSSPTLSTLQDLFVLVASSACSQDGYESKPPTLLGVCPFGCSILLTPLFLDVSLFILLPCVFGYTTLVQDHTPSLSKLVG